MLGLTTYDRHLLARFLSVFFVSLLTTFGLFVVIDGFTNVDGFQAAHRDAGAFVVLREMVSYYALQSTVFFDLIGPMLNVVSVMVVVAMLQRHGELHPLLAAGIPTRRLIVPFLVGGVLVHIALLANQELVIPAIAQKLQSPRGVDDADAQDVQPIYDPASMVLIAGQELIPADRTIRGAEFHLPPPSFATELAVIRADRARYVPAEGKRPEGWLLQGVDVEFGELPLTERGREFLKRLRRPQCMFLLSTVTFDELYRRNGSYKYLSTRELVRRIRMPGSGTVSRGRVTYFHWRVMRPVLNLVAFLVAIPLVARREARGLIANLAVCCLVMGGVLGVEQLCLYLATNNLVGPELAGWGPVIISGTMATWCASMVQT